LEPRFARDAPIAAKGQRPGGEPARGLLGDNCFHTRDIAHDFSTIVIKIEPTGSASL
jgi:hypothetical protein